MAGGKRGQRSMAEIQVQALGRVSRETRPLAPMDLDDEEATEWDAIVSRCPSDWFPRETHALLGAFCRHVVGLRRLSQLLHQHEHGDPGTKVDDAWLQRYDVLLRMRDRETRGLSSLATRLRLTQQSTVDPRKKKGRCSGPRPWDGGPTA
jgi:hypothetical protein